MEKGFKFLLIIVILIHHTVLFKTNSIFELGAILALHSFSHETKMALTKNKVYTTKTMVIFDQVIKLFKYLADPNKCTVWIKAISITDHMLSPYWTIHHAWYWCMCILEMVCSMQNFGFGYLNYFEKFIKFNLIPTEIPVNNQSHLLNGKWEKLIVHP